jgi:hypothetical protein
MGKPKSDSPVAAPHGQHIFHEDELHALAIQWKAANATGRHADAMAILEQIVERSTPMFERLALHEKFHLTVDLPILVSAAQEKVVPWLLRWEPSKGKKLFSWFSKCARNAFLSEIVKVNLYRRRYHSTSDNLDLLIGSEDHAVDKEDAAKEVRMRLSTLTCRWGHPQEIGALKYLIECVLDEDRDKQAAIRAAAYAWGISPDMAKFFYSWALVSLRGALAVRARMPFTEQDLWLLTQSYSHIPTLLDFMSWPQVKTFLTLFGGMRLAVPTIDCLARLKEEHQIWCEIDAGDKDPDSIAEVAGRHKKTPRGATEIYEEMCWTLDPRRAGEHYLFEPDEHHN